MRASACSSMPTVQEAGFLMILSFLGRVLVFGALWVILAEGDSRAPWLGVLAAFIAAATSLYALPPRERAVSLLALPAFLSFFVRQSVRGGFQVATLALWPGHGLRPALMHLPIQLPAGKPRVFMAAVMGLMPGTICVRLDDERLFVHVLDERLPVEQEVRELELRIARLFEG